MSHTLGHLYLTIRISRVQPNITHVSYYTQRHGKTIVHSMHTDNVRTRKIKYQTRRRRSVREPSSQVRMTSTLTPVSTIHFDETNCVIAHQTLPDRLHF